MPSNSATEKIRRAKRHLIAAKVLLSSLPSRYWTERETRETIQTVEDELLTTQEKIQAIKDPEQKKGK